MFQHIVFPMSDIIQIKSDIVFAINHIFGGALKVGETGGGFCETMPNFAGLTNKYHNLWTQYYFYRKDFRMQR